jgi:hypothetical protein
MSPAEHPEHDVELVSSANVKTDVGFADHGSIADARPDSEGIPKTQAYLQLICAGFSFLYAGTNDGTTGPLLPYMLQEYHISTSLITVM